MTRRRLARALARPGLVVTVLALGACVPLITEVGGIRIQPANGRVVRDGDHALFYADLNNTGKFGDELTRAEAPVARRAQLVGSTGAPLQRLEVPGTTRVQLRPGGERIVLSDLTRELTPGEVVIVTLFFEKTGALGVVASVE
jgi:copper(I)-binding protein